MNAPLPSLAGRERAFNAIGLASVVLEDDARDEEPRHGPERADGQHDERAERRDEPLALLPSPPHPRVLALGELGLLRGEVAAEVFDLVLPRVRAALVTPLDALLDLADVATVTESMNPSARGFRSTYRRTRAPGTSARRSFSARSPSPIVQLQPSVGVRKLEANEYRVHRVRSTCSSMTRSRTCCLSGGAGE